MRAALLTTAAIVTGAIYFSPVARAAPIFDSVTGTVSQTETVSATNGGPTISPLSEIINDNVEVSPLDLFGGTHSFTLAPHATCTGPGCSGGTETDNITLTFSGFKVNGNTLATFTEAGVFTAKYLGAILDCAKGDGVSPSSGETDCFIWNGAPATFNGSTTLTKAIPGLPGFSLEVEFFNATDWNISPSFQFSVIPTAVATPEPISLALFGTGLLGLGLARRKSA